MSVIRLRLPKPPPGAQWCTPCAAIAKGRFVAEHMDYLKELDTDGTNDVVEVKLGTFDLGMLEVAVSMSRWLGFEQVYPMPVPVCWSHLMPVTINVTGVMPAQAGSEDMVAQQLQQMGAKVLGAPKQPRQRDSHFPG